MPTFGGVCFLTFFYWSAPYICFGFLETLGGLFWVLFLTFQNFEYHYWNGIVETVVLIPHMLFYDKK